MLNLADHVNPRQSIIELAGKGDSKGEEAANSGSIEGGYLPSEVIVQLEQKIEELKLTQKAHLDAELSQTSETMNMLHEKLLEKLRKLKREVRGIKAAAKSDNANSPTEFGESTIERQKSNEERIQNRLREEFRQQLFITNKEINPLKQRIQDLDRQIRFLADQLNQV